MSHVNQDEAIAAIKRMKRRKALRTVRSVNRLVRRWYPKGTDFNQLTRCQIRQLEDWINSIHRESLNGETAYAYDSRLAQAA